MIDASQVADATPDAPLIGENLGALLFEELIMNGSMETATLAWFATGSESLSMRVDGSCHIEQHTMGSFVATSAGTLVVSYGSNKTITLTPDGQNMYSGSLVPGYQYTAGESVMTSASGAQVPAFSSSLVFPASVIVTNPTSSLAALSKSQGLSATWTPISDSVYVTINQYPDGTHTTSVDCWYDGTTGGAMVPASALAELQAGLSATVLIASEARGSSPAGAYTVESLAAVWGLYTTVSVEP